MRLIILGSPITRDVFRVTGHDAMVGSYFARTSLLSLVSPPLPRAVEISLPSDFQKRLVHGDLYKDAVSVLSRPNEYVLVDAADEHYDLLRVDGTIITRSGELVASGVLEQLGEAVPLDRRSQEGLFLFAEACRKLRHLIPRSTTLLLHKAFWAEHYRSGDQVLPYPKNLEAIRRHNHYLTYCYAQLERYLTPHVVAADPSLRVASDTHPSGLAPHNLVREYYEEIWRQISEKLPAREAA